MTEDQLEDLRLTLQDWQDDWDASDADMRDALRTILAEFTAPAR